MADESNLFDMTKSAINALKKPEIVKKIMELEDKVVVGEEIKSLYSYKRTNGYSKSTLIQKWKVKYWLAIQNTVS